MSTKNVNLSVLLIYYPLNCQKELINTNLTIQQQK
jgi:hypothetical protein